MRAVSQAVAAGHQLAAGGGAHGGHVEIGEADALAVQPVDVRRPQHGVAMARQVAVALVVGEDQDDIGGRLGRCRARGRALEKAPACRGHNAACNTPRMAPGEQGKCCTGATEPASSETGRDRNGKQRETRRVIGCVVAPRGLRTYRRACPGRGGSPWGCPVALARWMAGCAPRVPRFRKGSIPWFMRPAPWLCLAPVKPLTSLRMSVTTCKMSTHAGQQVLPCRRGNGGVPPTPEN